MLPFKPVKGSTVNIDVSSSTQNVKLVSSPAPISVRVMNSGSAIVWITSGDSTVAATTTTSIPVAAGATEVFTFDNSASGNPDLYIAAIAAGSTGKIYFTAGQGA